MILLRKNFIYAAMFCLDSIGNNDSRKNLMHMHVKREKQKCILTCADSFTIKRAEIELMKVSHETPFLIQGDLLRSFLNICKIEKHESVSISRKNLILDNFSDRKIDIKYKQAELEYPNLDRLFTQKADPSKYVGVNPKMLKKALDHFIYTSEGLKFKFTIVKVINNGEEGPIQIIGQGGDVKLSSVVMPVRIIW